MNRITLDGGLSLECINPLEAGFLAGDVESYFSHGVTISPGATVFDCGANIGVFSARVFMRLGGKVRIFAFEPLPPIFDVLARNVAEVLPGARAFGFGLGASEAEVDFTYFPMMTLLSSAKRGPERLDGERRRLAETVAQMIKEGRAYPQLQFLPKFLLMPMLESQIADLMKAQVYRSRVRPLSAVIEDEAVEVIDLLKIDVEGAELEVLAGISDAHWGRIAQVVVEAEAFASRAEEVRAVLVAKGFRVEMEQDAVQRAGDFGMLWARR